MSIPSVSVFHQGGGGASGGSGDVTGPASSTDNAIARFDGAGGKTLQNSTVTVGDGGSVGGVSTLVASSVITSGAGYLVNDGPGGDEKVQVAASFLLASDAHVKLYDNPDISSGSADLGFVRDEGGVLRFTNGSTGQGALRCARKVVALPGGGPVTAARTRSVITNAGAGAAGDFELGAAAEGLEYLFAVHAAQALNVIAAGADVIRIAAGASSAGGQASCATEGASLLLTCTKAGVWTGIASGVWVLT